jgi:O-antigen/teichoic acid export membrane protein
MTSARRQVVHETDADRSATADVERGRSQEDEVPAQWGRSFKFNVSALAIGQVITWSASILWTLVVPRALGPSELGILVVAGAAIGILGLVVGLGTPQYLIREMVARPDEAPSLLGTAFVLRAFLTPLFVAATVAWVHLAHYRGQEALIFYLVAGGAVLSTLLADPLRSVFQARERMEYLAYSDIISQSGQGLVGVAVILAGFKVVGLCVASVLVAAVALLLSAYWVHTLLRIDLRTNVARVRSMAAESLPYWAGGLFFMIYLWVDSVILSFMAPQAVVGWYGVATRLFGTLLFVPVILAKASLPRLVRGHSEGIGRLREVARAPLELAVVLSVPISVATAVAARPVMHLLYGPAYNQAVPVMIILGFCTPPMYAGIIIYQVLVAEKRPHVWAYVIAGAVAVNVMLNLVLIRFFQTRSHNGAIGAALSLLITELLIVSAGHALVGRHVFNASSWWRIARAWLAAAGMWAVAYVTRPWGAILSLSAAALTFAVLAVVLRVASAEERELIHGAQASVRRRLSHFPPLRRTSHDDQPEGPGTMKR